MRLSVFMTRRETALGWLLIALHTLVLPFAVVFLGLLLPNGLNAFQMNVLVFVAVFVLTLVIFHRFLRENFRPVLDNLSRCLKLAAAGFGIYYAGNVIVNILILNLSPDFANVNDANISQLVQENYELMWICTVLLVPVSEECMYRGLLFQGLYRKGRVLAYVLSILAFASIHVVGYIGTADPFTLLLCLLQYCPAGFALAWAYEKADSIWVPILIHMCVNCIAMLSMR